MEYIIMSDKEVSNNTLSDNSDTEKQEPAFLSADKNTKVKPTLKKPSISPTSKQPLPPKAPVTSEKSTHKTGRKTAAIALIIASVSIFASIGHYIWQQQQTSAQLLTLSQQNQRVIQQSQAKLKTSLTAEFNQKLQQQQKATSQSQQNTKQTQRDSETQLQQLAAQINQLTQQVTQRDPSDWLIHEAEYLIRVAARTVWLERDTKAAIGLLRDADNRLKALNNPKFLPVRALINEDIEALALMPTLTNQEAILTLMALNKQVPTLTLAGINLAQALNQTDENFTLSNDLDDWQSNLTKTWHKFLEDFITVRRRSGMVEPLIKPEQQQHLKQNLSLKVQLAQWAASEQKENVYQQTLLDMQQWLNEFFDMNLPVNKNFYASVEKLKKQTIYYEYPSDLRSLSAIKKLLKETQQGIPLEPLKVEQKKTEQAVAKENIVVPNSEEESGGQL